MGEAFAVVARVLPVIFLIILGHFLRRFSIISQKTIDDFKKLVVNLTLPALLFMAFADTAFEARNLLIVLAVFASCTVMLIAATLLRKPLGIDNRYWPSLFAGFETGMMGFSIFVAVYGAEEMYKLAIMDLGQVTFVFFVLVSVLKRVNGESSGVGKLILSFVKSPVIISIFLGIAAGLIDLPGILNANAAGGAIMETLNIIGSLTMPLICLAIGFELRIDKSNIVKPFLTAATRLLVLLGLAFVINQVIISGILDLDSTYEIALYTLFMLPPPFVLPIFMDGKKERDKQLILNTISIHIILTLVAFMGLILIYR